MKKTDLATILTPQDIDKIEAPLPESWEKAAGLLAHKRKELEKHLKTVRQEWDRHRPN